MVIEEDAVDDESKGSEYTALDVSTLTERGGVSQTPHNYISVRFPNRSRIVFCKASRVDGVVEELPSSGRSRYVKLVLVGGLVFVKILSSAGLRYYSVHDFFTNPNYILYDSIFSQIPEIISVVLTIWWTVSDVEMGLVTRVPGMKKVVNSLVDQILVLLRLRPPIVSNNDFFSTPARKAFLWSVRVCVFSSILSSSLAAFLGSVSLLELVVDNQVFLKSSGTVVAIANFASNMGYRFTKSDKNIQLFLSNGFDRSFKKIAYCVLGLIPFIASCFYGTDHSIRKILNMFDVYKSNPITGEGRDSQMEEIIKITLVVLLIFSGVSYCFTMGAEMLLPSSRHIAIQDSETEQDVFWVSVTNFRKKFNEHRAFSEYGRNLKFYHRDYWHPKTAYFRGICAQPFMICGELTGYFMQTMNSLLAIIIFTCFPFEKNGYTVSETVGSSIAALFFTFVSLKIYTQFNVVDWVQNGRENYVDTQLDYLEKADDFNRNEEQAVSKLREMLTKDYVSAEGDQPGYVASAWCCMSNLFSSARRWVCGESGRSVQEGGTELLGSSLMSSTKQGSGSGSGMGYGTR